MLDYSRKISNFAGTDNQKTELNYYYSEYFEGQDGTLARNLVDVKKSVSGVLLVATNVELYSSLPGTRTEHLLSSSASTTTTLAS